MLLKVSVFGLFAVLNRDDGKRADSAELWGRNLILANATWKIFGEGHGKILLRLCRLS